MNNQDSIHNMYNKIENCCSTYTELVNKNNSDIIAFPKTCNNRVCTNRQCMDHRKYLFQREHGQQIYNLNKTKQLYAWVFTGWVLPIDELNRKFCRDKLKYLVDILKQYSVTEFSVHMEIKLYRDNDNAYLHFHVVTGALKDLKTVRSLWGRQVKYQKPIKKKQLAYYVSKYAGKVPYFRDKVNREFYHLIVYKTQMHKFSIRKEEVVPKVSNYYHMDQLRYEINGCLYGSKYYYEPLVIGVEKKKYSYNEKIT